MLRSILYWCSKKWKSAPKFAHQIYFKHFRAYFSYPRYTFAKLTLQFNHAADVTVTLQPQSQLNDGLLPCTASYCTVTVLSVKHTVMHGTFEMFSTYLSTLYGWARDVSCIQIWQWKLQPAANLCTYMIGLEVVHINYMLMDWWAFSLRFINTFNSTL